mgnify:CR=1 FL=1|jgi:hypothetical protein|tara:strand:+ start:1028 stop:1252 length:225 start_codon:yes stop_codon:yes gene_type:complete
MSRSYDPAAAAYARMNLDEFATLEGQQQPEKSKGLLSKTNMSKNSYMDYKNPAVRIAKRMQGIRQYREDINGTE